MNIIPRTKIGRISFILAVSGLFLIFLLNFIAIFFIQDCIEKGECAGLFLRVLKIVLGSIGLLSLVTSFVTSLISLIKYKDYCIFLFVSSFIGLLGVIFVIGEFFPH